MKVSEMAGEKTAVGGCEIETTDILVNIMRREELGNLIIIGMVERGRARVKYMDGLVHFWHWGI